MPTVANIAVSMTARLRKFERGMQKASKLTLSLRSAYKVLRTSVLAASAALAGVVGGIAAVVNKQRTLIDSLAKVSSKLGISVSNLQALRFAAEKAGVASTTLDMALQRMVRRISEAAIGTGEALGALKELGVDIQKLSAMSPDQQFRAIANALAGVANQSDRVRLAFKLFDSEGVAVINMVRNGEQAFTDAAARVRELGLELNEIDTAKVEMMNDSMLDLQAAITGVGQKITVAVAPFVLEMTERFVQWGAEGQKSGVQIGSAVETIAVGLARIRDTIEGIKVGASFLSVLAQGFVMIQATILRGLAVIPSFILKALGPDDLVDEWTGALDKLVMDAKGAADDVANDWNDRFEDLAKDSWVDEMKAAFKEIEDDATKRAEQIQKEAEETRRKLQEEAEAAADKAKKEAEEAARKTEEEAGRAAAKAAGAVGVSIGATPEAARISGNFRQVSLRDVALGGVAASAHDSEQAKTNRLIGLLSAKFDEAIRAIERPTQIQFE